MIEPERSVIGRNRDYPWDSFDPNYYLRRNYVELHDGDRRIIETVRDFFDESFSTNPPPPHARGIDVGTGSNLYPALTMLPFCETITLYEFSSANVAWLTDQHARDWPTWDVVWNQFWVHLCKGTPYRGVIHPKLELSKRTEIIKGSVFELDGRVPTRRWHMGTIFFVAESITGQLQEFEAAMGHFFAALEPNAPFAAAFIEHSVGYETAGQQFPATDIGLDDVARCLHNQAYDVHIDRLGLGTRPLRAGYTGMIIGYGRAHRPTEQESRRLV